MGTIILALLLGGTATGAPLWMCSEDWQRTVDKPALELGAPGSWDDTHLFAPCVAFEEGSYALWYSGSSGTVDQRVFSMGLATSSDGVHFTRYEANPVFRFGEPGRSVLTPALLRGEDGRVLREEGQLRLWFSSADLRRQDALHSLHETRSVDGIHWAPPSPAQLEHVYAPTVLREDDGTYRMWYTDVSGDPWAFRHAVSKNGSEWEVSPHPCIEIDQAWERDRLFYPAVVKHDETYLMWYGAYWRGQDQKTALGLALSTDGVIWHKNPWNPVFRPEPAHPWESHYTTSQSVLRLEDGSWRIWYASRPAPPHVNKYYAIGSALWAGPESPKPVAWPERTSVLRQRVKEIFTLPSEECALAPEVHRVTQGEGYRIESVTYASEPGSRVTALLYVPESVESAVPAVILACGHGGSKSCLYAQYTGQLYATMGFACLVPDTIGEEERNAGGKMGTRAHDLYSVPKEERPSFCRYTLRRSVLGKIVWDLRRGVDYLVTRPEVDADRIGVLGYSLGGASAGGLTLVDPRVHAAVLSGWGFIPSLAVYGKECTRLPYQAFEGIMDFEEMTALPASYCRTLFLSGDSDAIIDSDEGGAVLVRQLRASVEGARRILAEAGVEGTVACEFWPGADHRPLFLTRPGVAWMQRHLMEPDARPSIPKAACPPQRPAGWPKATTRGQQQTSNFVEAVDEVTIEDSDATVRFGDWADVQGQAIESLYDTEARERGNEVVDIGAVFRAPKSLACFPEQTGASAAYSFQGWMESILRLSEKAP